MYYFSNCTTSQNIVGTYGCIDRPSPHLKFWGTVPPVTHKSPPMPDAINFCTFAIFSDMCWEVRGRNFFFRGLMEDFLFGTICITITWYESQVNVMQFRRFFS